MFLLMRVSFSALWPRGQATHRGRKGATVAANTPFSLASFALADISWSIRTWPALSPLIPSLSTTLRELWPDYRAPLFNRSEAISQIEYFGSQRWCFAEGGLSKAKDVWGNRPFRALPWFPRCCLDRPSWKGRNRGSKGEKGPEKTDFQDGRPCAPSTPIYYTPSCCAHISCPKEVLFRCFERIADFQSLQDCGQGKEQVKTEQMKSDHSRGYFRGYFRGHLRGTLSRRAEKQGKSRGHFSGCRCWCFHGTSVQRALYNPAAKYGILNSWGIFYAIRWHNISEVPPPWNISCHPLGETWLPKKSNNLTCCRN